MQGANKNVTIYHQEWDPETGQDRWTPQCLRGVSFYGRCQTRIEKDGLYAAMEGIMRVPPTAKPFALDPDLYYHIREIYPGDLVVLGHRPLNPPPEGLSPSILANMVKEENLEKARWSGNIINYDNQTEDYRSSITSYVWTVIGVTDNMTGRCPHIKVVLK